MRLHSKSYLLPLAVANDARRNFRWKRLCGSIVGDAKRQGNIRRGSLAAAKAAIIL